MTISNAARLAALLTATALAGCGQSQQQQSAAAPPTVTVANPVQRTVVDQNEYVGRFVAVDSVEVRARLSGYLSAIHFTDGQLVKKGDLLFTVDRRPFEIVLDQMRANLAQARANLAFTQADLARGQELVHNKTITEQTFDQRTQAKSVAEAAVAAQEAMVRSAELDLDQYTELRAPVDGRIGDRRVSVGNLVTGGTGGNTTLLATIVSVDPIRFEFTFDEASYLRYQRFALSNKDASNKDASNKDASNKDASNKDASNKDASNKDVSAKDASATDASAADPASRQNPSLDGGIPVMLKLIDEKDFQHQGKMDFVDNVIDRSSGTIRGRAVFGNPDGIFTPGMFGRIEVPGSPPYSALLVPDGAIGTEQVRKFVLVVDAGGVVRQRYVTLGQIDDGLRVVKDGLALTDRVIVNGLMRARPGAKVTVQEQGAPAPPPAKGPDEAKAG